MIPWPSCFAFLLAIVLIPRIRQWRPVIIVACLATIFGIFNITTTVFGTVPATEKAKSAIWLVYLAVIATIIARELRFDRRWRRRASAIFITAALALLLFASVEQRTSLGTLSNAFREKVFAGGADSDKRDLILKGEVRPKAFLSETSHAARGVSTLLLVGAALGENVLLSSIAVGGMLVAVTIFASPVPLGFALCAMLGLFIPEFFVKKRLVCVYLAFIGVFCVGILTISVLTIPVLRERWELYERGADRSSYRRTSFMREMAWKALVRNPVSGVGLGGEEELSNEFVLSGMAGGETVELVNNAMWSIPFYTGLVGTVLTIWFLTAIVKGLPVRHRLILISTVLVTLNCTGSISSSSAWIVGAFLFAICRGDSAIHERLSMRVGRGTAQRKLLVPGQTRLLSRGPHLRIK